MQLRLSGRLASEQQPDTFNTCKLRMSPRVLGKDCNLLLPLTSRLYNLVSCPTVEGMEGKLPCFIDSSLRLVRSPMDAGTRLKLVLLQLRDVRLSRLPIHSGKS
jgi:hypothetical protein